MRKALAFSSGRPVVKALYALAYNPVASPQGWRKSGLSPHLTIGRRTVEADRPAHSGTQRIMASPLFTVGQIPKRQGGQTTTRPAGKIKNS